jgi:hypothetical protein
MADRLGGKLDPHPIAPSFDRFPSMNAPALAPLVSTHHRQRVHVSVWRNSPSVASTGTIFERAKIETFQKSTPRCVDAGVARLKCIGMMENDVLDYYWMLSIRG